MKKLNPNLKYEYPTERFSGILRAQPLRFKKIPLNTHLIAVSVVVGTMIQRKTRVIVPNDVGIFQDVSGKKRYRIPMREFVNFNLSEGKTISDYQEEFKRLPDQIMVVASSDRVNQNGKIMYPIEAYLLSKEFLNEEINYQDLLNGGMKEGHTFDAIQDYTVAIL